MEKKSKFNYLNYFLKKLLANKIINVFNFIIIDTHEIYFNNLFKNFGLDFSNLKLYNATENFLKLLKNSKL